LRCRGADRPAEPSHYLAIYDLWKRRDSRVSMQFVNRTGTMIAERGPDDTSRKPPLAEAFRTNTVDPLSAIERIRGAFRAAGRIGSFMIPVLRRRAPLRHCRKDLAEAEPE
jgi:hypothetical protein